MRGLSACCTAMSGVGALLAPRSLSWTRSSRSATGVSFVILQIVGERRSLRAGVELAAYRTVQHALVAVSGTDDQPATAQLRYLSGALELEVRGFPPAGSAAAAALMAARERVMAHGGTLQHESPTSGHGCSSRPCSCSSRSGTGCRAPIAPAAAQSAPRRRCWDRRTQELEAEQEAFVALAVRRERARIARELHDIVSTTSR